MTDTHEAESNQCVRCGSDDASVRCRLSGPSDGGLDDDWLASLLCNDCATYHAERDPAEPPLDAVEEQIMAIGPKYYSDPEYRR